MIVPPARPDFFHPRPRAKRPARVAYVRAAALWSCAGCTGVSVTQPGRLGSWVASGGRHEATGAWVDLGMVRPLAMPPHGDRLPSLCSRTYEEPLRRAGLGVPASRYARLPRDAGTLV